MMSFLLTVLIVLACAGVALVFVGWIVTAVTALGNRHYVLGVLSFLLVPVALIYCAFNWGQTAYPRRLFTWGLALLLVAAAGMWALDDDVRELMATRAVAPASYELSIGFEARDIGPVLVHLDQALNLGLDVDSLSAFTLETPIETRRVRKLAIRHAGRPVALEYQVFMAGPEAPELTLLTSSKALAASIDQQLAIYSETVGQ